MAVAPASSLLAGKFPLGHCFLPLLLSPLNPAWESESPASVKVRSVRLKYSLTAGVAAHIFQIPGFSGPAGWSRPSVCPCSCPCGCYTFPPFFHWLPATSRGSPQGPPPDTNGDPSPCVCERGSTCFLVGLVSLATAPHRCVTFLSFFICLHGLKGQKGRVQQQFQSKNENERRLISLAGMTYLKVVFKIQIYL